MAPGIVGDNVGEVSVHLDVAPQRTARPIGALQTANPPRSVHIGNVDKGRLVVQPDDGVVATALRVGPAPHVIGADAWAAADLTYRKKRQQINVVALENTGAPVNTLEGLSEQGLEILGTTLPRRRSGREQQPTDDDDRRDPSRFPG